MAIHFHKCTCQECRLVQMDLGLGQRVWMQVEKFFGIVGLRGAQAEEDRSIPCPRHTNQNLAEAQLAN